jgi:hypothetical protein
MTSSLATLPPGVVEAAKLIAQLDDCLLSGFARLGPRHRESLAALVATLNGSPLEQPIVDAVAAVGRSEFLTGHFVSLAASRAAIQGAQHDALVAQLGEVFALSTVEVDDPPAMSVGGAASLLSSTEQWLMEIALAGFKHLEENSVSPFVATLEQLQAERELTGLAVLLTGFVTELLAHMPVERRPSLPVFRWADMWTAAMIRTQQLPGEMPFQEVQGRLTPFGLSVQSHANFVCAALYGLLEANGTAQTVRVPLTSYKVDVIAGPEIWELFGDAGEPILKALAGHKTLAVNSAELYANGDLLLRAKPKVSKTADPFAAAEFITAMPAPPALFRHPVHIGHVVHLNGACDLPLAAERLASESELTEELLSDAAEMIALVRFDQGGWRAQPLCIRIAKRVVISGEGIAAARKKLKSKTLAILKERSSKLLRA